MILVVGGGYQGKRNFVVDDSWNNKESVFASCRPCSLDFNQKNTADGQIDMFEKAYETPLVTHLESYVKRALERNMNPELFLERILTRNEKVVLIADEIGSGLYPPGDFEREWREAAGRISQKAALAAEQVYRVVCGIGTRIK